MSYRDDYRYPYEQSEVKDENPMTSTKCPKCGSCARVIEGTFIRFECRSHMWEGKLDHQSDDCRNRGELATLRASLAKAVEALKPFDEKLRREMDWGGPTEFAAVQDRVQTLVRLGDLRRASTVLKEISKDL